MIPCGWCGVAADGATCAGCGRDPGRPWEQRGLTPPEVRREAGRPAVDPVLIRERYEAARADILRSGGNPTVEAIAEALDRSPRTVREWRQRYDLR